MIEKERLEELIKQKAKIYSSSYDEEVDLGNNCSIELIFNSLYLVVDEGEGNKPTYHLDYLYEDINDGKFENKFSNLTRMENVTLPLWKEVKKDMEKVKCGFYVIAEAIDISLEYRKSPFVHELYLYAQNNGTFKRPATWENYLELCQIFKEIFEGSVKECSCCHCKFPISLEGSEPDTCVDCMPIGEGK